MSDSEMREQVLNGSTLATRQIPSGSGSSAWGTSHNGLGLRTTATGNPETVGNNAQGGSAWTQTLNPLGATFNIAPSYLPTPLEVVVSQYVPYAYGARTGTQNETAGVSVSNVIMVDSDNCGLIGNSMPVTMDKWSDPERDIENIKLKESWGLGILEQGKSIAVARNISNARNYNFENSNSQTLSEIPRDSGIL